MTQFHVEQTSQATGDGTIVLQADWGSTIPAHDSGDLCYWLYGGIPPYQSQDTNPGISGIYVDSSWNLELDPSLIVTSKLPLYNLFSDPRGMASANPWTRPQDNNNTTTSDVSSDENAVVAKVTTTYEPLSVSAGGELFGRADANAFVFTGAQEGAPNIGVPVWGHKMALPDDIKKALAAGERIPLTVSWYIGAYGEGEGSDAAVLSVLDKAGDTLATLDIYSELANYGSAWTMYWATLDALPAEACNLELYLTWQTGEVTRFLCFPMVTNSDDPNYCDGDTPGWIWSATMNNSPSRQSDLTVTREVLAAGDGIGVYLWPVDDRSANDGTPVMAWSSGGGAPSDWFAVGAGSAQSSASLHCTQIAIGIFLQSDYAWTFKTEDGTDPPTPYGVTINNVTVFGAAGNPAGDTETVKPSSAIHPARDAAARRDAARHAAFRAACDAHGPAQPGDHLTVKGLGTFTVRGLMDEAEAKAAFEAAEAQRAAAKARATQKAKRKPETFEELCARVGRDARRARERRAEGPAETS